MDNKKLLNEFIELLKDKNRKEINKWKEKNHFIFSTTFRGEQLCNDADVVYILYRQVFEEWEDILKFVKYIDEEDPFNSDVKWISHKKKNEFLQWITSKIITEKKPKEFLEIKMNQKLTDEEYQAILEAQRSIIEE